MDTRGHDRHPDRLPLTYPPVAGSLGLPEIVVAARTLAWWTHVNLASRTLYRARQESFARLRATLASAPRFRFLTFEERAVVACARTLAACSDSNRMGLPYYERKAAFARLRGALWAYDVMLQEAA